MSLMGGAGYVIARKASEIGDRAQVSATLVGVPATAAVTSLPKLATTVAAVRLGALQLAVGGNTFDALFLIASDVAYREGSLYHAVLPQNYLWIVSALLMTGILIGGLILRQRRGPGRIGGESMLLLLIYAGSVAVQVLVAG
ncbi:hypothetical protein [Paracoccus rhizosphaerae]|uniref:Sodium/calcium exchanger membrane region domain-containing protein n=1 Tax=Paracoccus rhizosphaerae TaxID=1133347 RepID=A0ABV6CKE5_9RHOB|nr:hypothetical protein [Paracoccus rhizosphaerae]